ncbi:MAG: hypothetical protein WCF18_17785 [Chthoniobacteraceae bacterium]
MAEPQRIPRWAEAIIIVILIAPLVLAVLPIEHGRMFVVAGSICFAAPLGGLWQGEKRGLSMETRAGLGCLFTLGIFAFYILWAVVVARVLGGAFLGVE